MFFERRSNQAEYFDLPGRPEAEILKEFHDLDRLNRYFLFSRPFEDVLPRWLGNDRCARLDVLDIGAGTGSLGIKLSSWAKKRGWDWRFTNLDANPLVLKTGQNPPAVIGSALALPFPDNCFDLVVASQMTHHLTDEEVVQHLREAWRVTRGALFISDLHRNIGLYSMLAVLPHFMGVSRSVKEDALISVKRGFHLAELRELARRAELPDAKISLYYGTRILLRACK